MPVYLLDERPVFPPPSEAEASGLLAIDGDLSAERLLAAYSSGIFPWYCAGEPILWFSPDPRTVLLASELRIPRGVRRNIERLQRRAVDALEIRFDTAFERVIAGCAGSERPGQQGTWLTDEMLEAYIALHELGYAHSSESWLDGELVGGAYGVSLGHVFSGESMFYRETGASQAAVVALIGQLATWGIELIDCQTYTRHFARLGARPWPRERFLAELGDRLRAPTRRGRWEFELDPSLSWIHESHYDGGPAPQLGFGR
jgi:leucyl/phenylalanyl-tRNA--protein transferase